MMHRMHYSDYLQLSKSKVGKILFNGIESVRDLISAFFKDYLVQVVSVITVVIVLFTTNWRMAVLTLVMLPAMIFFSLIMDKKTFKLQEAIDKAWDEWFEVLGDSITNMWTVKTFSLEEKRVEYLEKIRGEALLSQKPVQWRWVVHDSYMQVVVMVARLLVVWWGMRLYSLWYTSPSEIVMFFIYINFVYYPLLTIFWEMDKTVKQVVSFEKLTKLTNQINHQAEQLHQGKESELSWDIVFSKLRFGYTPENKVIKDISFIIPEWSTVALVGETWSGKSTLANLLLRFWEPDAWNIFRWDNDIASLSIHTLRSSIWVIQQDTTLFNATIRENLSLCLPDNLADSDKEEKIKEALKLSQAKFAFDLPQGLDTTIGERWLKLSWWEKQRLALARLLLKNPQMILLDEATSALDNQTEFHIKKVIDTVFKQKTMLVIAHRLSTIQSADHIIVMSKGKILEQGSYQDLIEKKWALRNLAHPSEVIV